MTVYVDNVKIPWRGMIMSHMTADTELELHAFAEAIGMRREWAQLPPEHSVPHYDVSEGKRQLSIRLGAEEEDWRDSKAIERHRQLRRGTHMSMLEVWKVKDLGPNKLGIQCPHCSDKAVVTRRWARPHHYKTGDKTILIVGRPCTYCSKTSQIPEKFKGGKTRG